MAKYSGPKGPRGPRQGRRPEYMGRLDHGMNRYMRPEVVNLLENSPRYVRNATYDTGEAFREVVYVSPKREGAVPALHARWQEEGIVDHLNEVERKELGRAGFRIFTDRAGCWAFWREHKLSHLWLSITNGAWSFTHSPQAERGARWKAVCKLGCTNVPLFEGYQVTPEVLVRESFVEAMTSIKMELPPFMITDSFFGVVKKLCDYEVLHMHQDTTYLAQILSRIEVVNPVEVEDAHEEDLAVGDTRRRM